MSRRKTTTENNPGHKGLQLELAVPDLPPGGAPTSDTGAEPGIAREPGPPSGRENGPPAVRENGPPAAREPSPPSSTPAPGGRASAPGAEARELIPPVFTVTDLISDVNVRLRNRYGSVWVEGELGRINEKNNVYYFVLKDPRSTLDCVLFARAAAPPFELKEGLQVLVRGYLEIFAARGKFTLYVEMIEPRGEGALLLAFLQLKRRLEAEGLFERPKRRWPELPRVVGIVTSESGAALQDMLKIARRRVGCRILIANALVQGATAPLSVISALQLLERRHDVDVIILARGGGSLEDLAAFNDEGVVRAVHACAVPVVTAIGHQTDTTLVDFVSDLRAATPTEAAERVFADPALLGKRLETALARCARAAAARVDRCFRQLGDRRLPDPVVLVNRRAMELADAQLHLERAVTAKHELARTRLDAAARRLAAHLPQRRVSERQNRLDALTARLHNGAALALRGRLEVLSRQAARLQALSPLAVLERGYAVVAGADGAILRDADQVRAGDALRVRLGRGRLDATVDAVHPPEEAS